jgi:hypothetical protein
MATSTLLVSTRQYGSFQNTLSFEIPGDQSTTGRKSKCPSGTRGIVNSNYCLASSSSLALFSRARRRVSQSIFQSIDSKIISDILVLFLSFRN